jgi:hypothetical protein
LFFKHDRDSDEKNSDDCQDKNYGGSSKDDQSSPMALNGYNDAPAEAKESLNGKELIQKVCEYYFDDEDLQEKLETWATENCKIFNPFDTEYSLEQMKLFEDFRLILEGRLDKFVFVEMLVLNT